MQLSQEDFLRLLKNAEVLKFELSAADTDPMNISGISSGNVFAINLSRLSSLMGASDKRMAAHSRLADPASDFASFSLASTLRGQISGYQITQQNAQSAVSMSQTVSGGLSSLRDMMAEVRSLADSWNSGTGDQVVIQARVADLSQQISAQIGGTRFGSQQVLQGSSVTTQIGPNGTDVMTLQNPDAAALIGGSVSSFAAATPNSGAVINTAWLDAADTGLEQAQGLAAADQSRLGFAIDNASTQMENLTGAEGKITDFDVASEMVNRTKLQMMQEVNTTLLAQSLQNNHDMVSVLLGSLKH